MTETIILVDAYAQIYRGYYAIPPLTNSKGMHTNAVYATAKFLIALERDYPSSVGAVVFDKGRPEHRLKIIPAYKATRPPMPQELRSQIPFIRDWIVASGWTLLEYEGVEADDIVAALAVKFDEYPVKIVSADKDISQVINDRIQMLVPDKKFGGFCVQGVSEVIARFAVRPEQIVDYLSLIGDSSDNIPGIDGVGPKTAAKLISQFGSIEEMLKRTAEIQNDKLREKVASSGELLAKNKKVITLDLSIPEESWTKIEKFRKVAPDIPKLKSLAEELELKSILKELDGLNKPEKSQSIQKPQVQKDEMFTPDLFGF